MNKINNQISLSGCWSKVLIAELKKFKMLHYCIISPVNHCIAGSGLNVFADRYRTPDWNAGCWMS